MTYGAQAAAEVKGAGGGGGRAAGEGVEAGTSTADVSLEESKGSKQGSSGKEAQGGTKTEAKVRGKESGTLLVF